jgi:hypothetical protein
MFSDIEFSFTPEYHQVNINMYSVILFFNMTVVLKIIQSHFVDISIVGSDIGADVCGAKKCSENICLQRDVSVGSMRVFGLIFEPGASLSQKAMRA